MSKWQSGWNIRILVMRSRFESHHDRLGRRLPDVIVLEGVDPSVRYLWKVPEIHTTGRPKPSE